MRKKLKKDSTFKEFWRDNERFADLFNGAVFGGREVICAGSLQEMDTDVSGTIKMEGAFCNYNMNLLEIRKSGEYVFHNKDVAMAFDFTRAVFENRVDEAIQKYKAAKAKEEVWHFIDTMIDTEKMIGQEYIRGDNMCEGLRLWAQEKADKAEKSGWNRGLSEGISQGIRKGELIGELVGQKMIINRMIENNMSLEEIAQLIGFSAEKVKEILETEKTYH